jgi:MFS transporter, ACS family, hexuronate transporter
LTAGRLRWRRWAPVLAMMLVSLISYIDRSALAVLSPSILADTQMTAERYGYIVLVFNIAYMVGNPLWGRFLDRFGLRAGMFAAVGFWSLASALHALAGGFWSFAVARAALGDVSGRAADVGTNAAAGTAGAGHGGFL